MDFKKMWLAGVAAAVAVSGALVLTAGPASAATCQAQAFSSCVAVSYQTSSVKSIRVNGRCLVGPSGHYSSVIIRSDETPYVQAYGGGRCEGNTEKRAQVSVGGEDAQRFRWITVF
ncbi:hypothetical protein [Lentzea aerocolonigenes]|nr:hypothetical protein [Lentzea aerocolonigenes]